MIIWFRKRTLNFLMSGWPFEDKKNISNNPKEKKEGGVYETKMDYVSKVTGFLESGVKEMTKNIKKL